MDVVTELQRVGRSQDPFGSTIGERVWRRLAGAGSVVTPAATGFTLWTTELLPWVTIGAVVIYLLGVPASWAVTRHGGAPIRRHVVAAVLVGSLVSVVLSLPSDLLGWRFYALFSIGLGVPLAALAAWSGLALPGQWVRPVAVVGLLVTGVVLPFGTWLDQRPPVAYDFVVVHDPEAVRQHFTDAYALAQAIAERFEQRAGTGNARTAYAEWAVVGRDLRDEELDNVPSRIRFTADSDLPRLRTSGESVRLVTTIFDDEPLRGCVIVTSTTIRAEPQACADLDLAD